MELTGPIARLEGHSARVWDLAANENGQLLASVSADASIKLWNLSNVDAVSCTDIPTQHEGDIYGIGIVLPPPPPRLPFFLLLASLIDANSLSPPP